jgi:hypothetical protein
MIDASETYGSRESSSGLSAITNSATTPEPAGYARQTWRNAPKRTCGAYRCPVFSAACNRW